MKNFRPMVLAVAMLAANNGVLAEPQVDMANLSVLSRLRLVDSQLRKELRQVRLRLAGRASLSALTLMVPVAGWIFAPDALKTAHEVNKLKKQIKVIRGEIKKSKRVLVAVNSAGVAIKERKRLKVDKYLQRYLTAIGAIPSDYNAIIVELMAMDAKGMGGLFVDGEASHAFYGELVARGFEYFKLYRSRAGRNQEQGQDPNGQVASGQQASSETVRRIPAGTQTTSDSGVVRRVPAGSVGGETAVSREEREGVAGTSASSGQQIADLPEESTVTDSSAPEASETDTVSFPYVS